MKEHKTQSQAENKAHKPEDKPAQVRKIVIKTSIRAGQGKNRYAAFA